MKRCWPSGSPSDAIHSSLEHLSTWQPHKDKVIISCAVTGSVHTPTMSPHLPHAGEIAEQAIEAAEAGAAILHLHARDPRTAARPPTRGSSTSSCRASSAPPTR
jgi:hypothetical protein